MNDLTNKARYRQLVTMPRRWFPLWVLDWYILREFLVKYSILMLVFIILFFLNDVYNNISDFLEAETPMRETVYFFLAKLPGNIRFILPISMLLGCMWCMATFGKNLEITAMRASGVSLFRCGVPIFFVGILVTALNIYFNEFLVPKTENIAERIYATTAERRRAIRHLLAFRSLDGKRHWLFQTFMRGNVQQNVTLRTFWDKHYINQFLGEPDTDRYKKMVALVLPDRAAGILGKSRSRQTEEVFKALNGRKVDILANTVDYDISGNSSYIPYKFIQKLANIVTVQPSDTFYLEKIILTQQAYPSAAGSSASQSYTASTVYSLNLGEDVVEIPNIQQVQTVSVNYTQIVSGADFAVSSGTSVTPPDWANILSIAICDYTSAGGSTTRGIYRCPL